MKCFIIALAVSLALPFTAFCQANNTEDQRITNMADSVLYGRRGLKNNKEVVGASIGVYWKGKTYFFNYGLADREHNIPVTNETLFEIGSNTKVFTGLLLAHELTNKTVTEQTTIDKFVQVDENIRNKVRLIDLADYTSGLPTFHDSASLAELDKIDSNYSLNLVTDEYLLQTVAKTKELNNYGHYEYNNLSFGLLGYILCKMNKMSYDALLRKNVLTPLKMVHTYATLDTTNANLAHGYDEGARAPFINISGLAPAGIIKSNITDMMHFIRYQVEGGSSIDNVLALAAKPYHEEDDMKTALGWHAAKRYGSDYYMMRGDTYGASSAMAFSKDKKFGVVILLNSTNSDLTQSLIGRMFVRTVEGDPDFIAAFNNMPEVQVSKEILESYTGNYSMHGMMMQITTADEKLYAQIFGQPKGKLKAVGEQLFNIDDVIASIEFVKDKQGKVEKLVLHQNGQELPFVRK